jgi:hypothetical protein
VAETKHIDNEIIKIDPNLISIGRAKLFKAKGETNNFIHKIVGKGLWHSSTVT